jgi:hypothetical protein
MQQMRTLYCYDLTMLSHNTDDHTRNKQKYYHFRNKIFKTQLPTKHYVTPTKKTNDHNRHRPIHTIIHKNPTSNCIQTLKYVLAFDSFYQLMKTLSNKYSSTFYEAGITLLAMWKKQDIDAVRTRKNSFAHRAK